MALLNVNDNNFEKEIISSGEPVLADFYADWCTPCKMLSPVVDEIAKEYKVCKINVDEAEHSVLDYSVMSVPTLIAFKNGEEISRLSGIADKEEIIKLFK